MINCPKCNTEFNPVGKWGLRKFCSRKCANSKVFSEESKKLKSDKLKGNVPHNKGKLKPRPSKICESCNKSFEVTPDYKYRKYCNMQCYKNSGKLGGIKDGSGYSKTGYYNGIYCGSTYELVYVIHCLDTGKEVKRFSGYLEGDGIKYYPDFIEGNCIIEIKGYWTEGVDRKTELAKKMGYDIVLLYKRDLQLQFDWVKEKYQYKKLQELYENKR